MKKIKIIIITLLILIFIGILTVGVLLIYMNENSFIAEKEEILLYKENELKEVDNSADFYTISNCIQAYFDYIYNRNIEENEEDIKIQDENLYYLLSENYIKENNITKDTVSKYVFNINDKVFFVPSKMYAKQQNDNILTFVVNGFIENINYEYIQEINIYVNIDIIQNTYSIEPITENVEEIANIKIPSLNQQKIDKNGSNMFVYQKINDEILVKKYLDFYKKTVLSKPELIYKNLNLEYKNKRFSTFEQFKRYIEIKKEEIKTARMEKYLVTHYTGYTEYICIDQNENYYIFKETSPMQYTVILDDYTLILPQFISKYNSANAETKIAMQVDRVRKALNNQDYKFVYSKLANSFKQNYFREQADFENYAKANFYKTNEFKYTKLEAQDDNYIYTIQIINADDDTKMQEKTIVIHLKADGDFEFSFSV